MGLSGRDLSFSALLDERRQSTGPWSGATTGPVQYVSVKIDADRSLACVKAGLYLVRDERGPIAILVGGAFELVARRKHVTVEVMANARERGDVAAGSTPVGSAGLDNRSLHRLAKHASS